MENLSLYAINSSELLNYVVAYISLGSVLFFLAIFVFAKNPQNSLNRIFSIYSFAIAWWSLFTILMITSNKHSIAYFWDQICLVGAIFIPTTFFHFVQIFLRLQVKNKWFIRFFYLCSIFFLFTNFTTYFVYDVKPQFAFSFYTIPGWAYHVFVSYFSLLSTIGTIQLFIAKQKSKADRTTFAYQAKWLFYSSLLGYIGGGTNFMVVYGVEIPLVTQYANYAVLAYGLSMAYIILRYRFLDIEIIIKRTLVFTGLFGVLLSVVVGVTALTQSFIGKYLHMGDMSVRVLSIVVAMLLFDPVRKWLVNLTDKYLFQKKVDYRQLLKEASEHLAHVDSLKRQTMRIVSFMIKKARIKNASIFVYTRRDPSGLVLEASRPAIRELCGLGFSQAGSGKGIKIPFTHPLIVYLYQKRGPIEKTHLNEMREKELFTQFQEELNEIHDLFVKLKAEAAVPCFGGEAHRQNSPLRQQSEMSEQVHAKAGKGVSHLRGILFLGSQKSDEPYTDEDLDVFSTLAQESSIAFENARLYDEAIQKQRELEQMNSELENAQSQLIRALEEADLTNLRIKQMQGELVETKKRALLSGLSAAVGHEIRNPLTPLMTHVVFCQRALADGFKLYEEVAPKIERDQQEKFSEMLKEFKKRFDKTQGGLDRIKGVVGTLIDLVRARTDNKQAVQLKLVIAAAWEEVRFQTYSETLVIPKLTVDIPGEFPFVEGITQDLQGVFVNLMINSLHAMEKSVNKDITIRGMIDSKYPAMVMIEFQDSGFGIPEENLSKVFDHGFTTKGEKGTGIGLFYCKDNIERVHQGSIAVRSEMSVGTTFTIRLPIFNPAKK